MRISSSVAEKAKHYGQNEIPFSTPLPQQTTDRWQICCDRQL